LRHFLQAKPQPVTRPGDIDPDPAMPGLAETHEIASNFLGCFNWHRVTRRVVLETANNDANDLTFHVQQRRAGFSALRRQIKTHVSR
jgi:hypothetical protein